MKCAALLFAAALLFLLAACTGPVDPSPAPTATPPPATATPAPTPEPAPTAAPSPTPAAPPTETPAPTPAADCTLTAGGREYPARLFSENLSRGGGPDFTCILPLEDVTAAFEHNAWVFRSAAAPEAWLELSFIVGGDVESLLPGFMDGYLDFTAVEFSEAASLGRVRGEVGRVSAENEALRADAWLLNISGGTVAAVLRWPPSAAESEALLRAVLDSFELKL